MSGQGIAWQTRSAIRKPTRPYTPHPLPRDMRASPPRPLVILALCRRAAAVRTKTLQTARDDGW
eukprot:1168875-Rhodomonas_salina.1